MTEKDKKIIEDAERDGIPIFVFTAKDRLIIKVLRKYAKLCMKVCHPQHTSGVIQRMYQIEDWQREHPERIKFPD